MDTELLKQWTVLRRLTESELRDIAYVVVYGDLTEQSAIFIDKTSGEVYGIGSKAASKLKLPMIDSFPSSGNKIKIDHLCGLGLEKIVVGSTLVGGLANGKVHVWYFPMLKSDEANAVIMFERYTSSTNCTCSSCISHVTFGGRRYIKYYSSRSVGGINLNVCPDNTDKFCTYTATSPPPSGASVVRLVNSNVAKMICCGCSRKCSSSKLGGYDLEYCKDCNIYPEYSVTAVYFEAADVEEPKEEVFECNDFVDIACGEHYLALLSKSNELIIHGYILYHSFSSPVSNPDQIVIKAISCGPNHLAALSSKGELYTCGLGTQGQLGYKSDDVDLTLHRVKLEGVVIKVCCGLSATICLTLDGSVYCFGSNMKLNRNKQSLLVNQLDTDVIFQPTKIMEGQKFIDIASVPLINTFFACTKSMVYSWGHKEGDFPLPEVIMRRSSLMEALVNHPVAMSCVGFSPRKNHQVPSTHEADFTHLYGKDHLSDLILKLSDGNFPAHSLVLFTRSTYFRDNILQETASLPKELDMSSYNPVAYKVLLQYFYHLPPDDLGCSDLVDLYLLATSYKETDIIVNTYAKIKEKIGVDNVKLIHNKAKAAGCEVLLHQCDVFMRSPEFQAKLLDFLAQSTETTLSLLG